MPTITGIVTAQDANGVIISVTVNGPIANTATATTWYHALQTLLNNNGFTISYKNVSYIPDSTTLT